MAQGPAPQLLPGDALALVEEHASGGGVGIVYIGCYGTGPRGSKLGLQLASRIPNATSVDPFRHGLTKMLEGTLIVQWGGRNLVPPILLF